MLRAVAVGALLSVALCADCGGKVTGDTAPAKKPGCVHARRAIPTDTPLAIAADATTLFWFDNATGVATLHSTPKCDAGPLAPPVALPMAATGLVLDGQNAYLSAASTDTANPGGGVFAVNKVSGAVTKIVNAPMGAIAVAVSNGWVYWTEEGPTNFSRARPDGTSAQVIVSPDEGSPHALTVLDNETVCVTATQPIGVQLRCFPMPLGATYISGPPLQAKPLVSHGNTVYFASDMGSGSGVVGLDFSGNPDNSAFDTGFAESDAGAGNGFISGIAPASAGLYVFYGTGTLQLRPADHSAPREETLTSSLPPFVFFADDDGIYFDANVNGLEVVPSFE
jgi:hypothetical protein